MIVKKQRIYNKIKFVRRKYSGYSICEKLCFGSQCEAKIRIACNQVYVSELRNYCFIHSDFGYGL